MNDFSQNNYKLPQALRSKLAKPMGELVKGTVEETVPILKDMLVPHDFILVAVGDVTAELFVEHDFEPDIVVTDGQTKRQELDEWKEFDNFTVLKAHCPAAEITSETWKTLQQAVKLSQAQQVHVKIYGEEDLLVLPLLIELSNGSKIVYGQPDTGAVIRTVSDQSRQGAIDIVNAMKISKE